MDLENNVVNGNCHDFPGQFGPVFHIGNFLLGVAFLMPQWFTTSELAMRGLITAAYLFLTIWSALKTCSAAYFLYNVSILVISSIYLTTLIVRHFPVFIPKHLEPIYAKVFRPFRITKKDFWVLMKESYTKNIRQGDFFCLEGYTKVEDKIHILMSGRMSVKCDGVFLHNINPNEFIDSIEWKAKEFEDDPNDNSENKIRGSFKVIGRLLMNKQRKYQVTTEATIPCRLLVLNRRDVEAAFQVVPSLKMLLDCLIGKDIAKKLYATSDNVCSIKDGFKLRNSRKNLLGNMLNFRRTASADAINTGAKGWVRSDEWVEATNAKELIRDTGEQVMVMNLELDVPPTMDYLPHGTPVHSVDRETMAEAQFLAQQRKYWPSGFI